MTLDRKYARCAGSKLSGCGAKHVGKLVGLQAGRRESRSASKEATTLVRSKLAVRSVSRHDGDEASSQAMCHGREDHVVSQATRRKWSRRFSGDEVSPSTHSVMRTRSPVSVSPDGRWRKPG